MARPYPGPPFRPEPSPAGDWGRGRAPVSWIDHVARSSTSRAPALVAQRLLIVMGCLIVAICVGTASVAGYLGIRYGRIRA